MIGVLTKKNNYENMFSTNIKSDYTWDNLIISQRQTTNWVKKMHKGSILHDLWLLLTSPTD